MNKRVYRVLKQELENVSIFEADENEEAYQILKSLNCHKEIQVFSITKEVIEKAKQQARKYETLEILVEMERAFLSSDEEAIEYLCK